MRKQQRQVWEGPEELRPLLISVTDLTPDPENARKHTDRNLDVIRRSLVRFGQRKPIVVQRKGNLVRAGNGTFAAAKALGWTHVAAVTVDEDDRSASEFALVDNRAAELAEWDREILLGQLQGMDAIDEVGFSLDDFHDLLDVRANPFVTIRLDVDTLKRHPKNYQTHPEDQLAHIIKSIELHGFYRNVVVARDNTILAGHGVVEAARKMGKKRVPVIRLDLDPDEPRALKVLTSDNEIGNLAETDDRALTEMLKGILELDGLEGTGFNEQQLAALAFVTRPEHEVADKNEAAEWVGMPGFERIPRPLFLIISFRTPQDREDLLRRLGVEVSDKMKSIWWPMKEREDPASLRVRG